MTVSLALSPPLAALKLRAAALNARAVGLWRAYPRETLGFGVLGLVGAAAIAGSATLPDRAAPQVAPPAPPPLLLKQVAPQRAVAINQAIPVTSGPNPAASPFAFTGSAGARSQALTCLASAVYYEAGNQD